MKKLFLFLIIGAALASCKKTRTCTCSGSGGAPSSTRTIKNVTKRQAKAGYCASYSESTPQYFTANGTNVPQSNITVQCKLK